MPTATRTVTIYTTPNCQACRLTALAFKAGGIEPRIVKLDEEPAAREYVTEELGYSEAPVVVVDDQDHWSGLKPDQIKRVIS